ncbi:MAG: PQQ-binding-like beta-propeller repeat protein, partial [Planctomycetaceae bacterium]|nr:PQQ-binding-like beta-propeller repeat protein [Planctomycetaceae bacterium]
CPASDAVFSYDPANGKEIWRVNYPDGYSVTPRPVYGSGLVYVCTGFNKPHLLAIDPTGQGDVTESHLKWDVDKAIPHSPSILHLDGYVYLVSDKGIASCLDAKTGEEQWQERLGGNFSASPLAAEGRIYFQDENGKTTVVAASPEYKMLGTSELNPDERTFASYAVAPGVLFLRSEGGLYRIEQK